MSSSKPCTYTVWAVTWRSRPGLVVKSLARWLGQVRVVFIWKRGVIVPSALRELVETIREHEAHRHRCRRK